MATTTAPFTPALATGGSNSTALATTGGAGSNAGGALATFTPGMDVQQGNGNNYGGAGNGGPLASVQQMLQQPSVKKAMPIILMALAVLLFALLYVLINMPSYRPLMVNMSEADQQTAMEALRASEFKPVLDPSTGQITVPSNKYHEARIFLASKGLPKTGNTGIDSLKDQSAMTTSQFMEQVRYTAAMEQELARTIMQIDSIQQARVHLAMPKQSVFVRDRTPPKASVIITPHAGRSVSQNQVQALVHLVASSVPLMTPENVAVVDNQGKLITDSSNAAALGLTSAQSNHKQKMEDVYRQRVMQILSPIVGDNNVRSQVNMALDFTQTEVTTEDFDTREKGPKTRSEALSEDKSGAAEAAGIPGTLSNTPPPAPSATTNSAASTLAGSGGTTNSTTARSTRNYELDRSVRHVKNATGTVERLSVAVLINERAPTTTKNEKGEVTDSKPNPYSEEEITRMQDLVRGVVGYDEKRGDVVTVVQAKFEPTVAYDLSIPWYKDESLQTYIKSGLLGVMFLAFIMMVIRPAVLRMLGLLKTPAELEAEAAAAALAAEKIALADGELSPEDMNAIQLGEGETLEEIKAKLKPKKSSISMEMLDTANTYDDKVALVRMIVAEDTSRVASVLKKMIKVA
ncbi:flagellar basal-body MS-ring/collar protein FliF [Limnohabitans sp. MMS-10A-178]|uniref:flagellar basal-body MS-ring/collar protein FliF n=1 Tax=Limnohabitans sp. MMS-10A-178 TaxID=1835767 RepID=UPI000DD262CB|nr:flagellar basal-body MS-ring/collar protein FliF [Limnohabitans sp. MMS-10A-178]PUE16507.1 flagellar M-ring protein FliF [Limnohabitans sp. MMS-10A-178]